MNPRYLLIIATATALNSCATVCSTYGSISSTYKSMRTDPSLRSQDSLASEAPAKPSASEITVTPATASAAVAPLNLPSENPAPNVRAFTQKAQPSAARKQKTFGGSNAFMQPNVLSIPSKDDLKETATSTQKSTHSSGLTVPRN